VSRTFKEEIMRKLDSYIRKYDPILGPGAGARLYRRLQQEAAIKAGIARTLKRARRLAP
jgi:hypothetical protein